MNNSKFKELSNDEVMEVEGGFISVGIAAVATLAVARFILADSRAQYKKGYNAGKR